MMCNTCDDNRFKLIEKYKTQLVEATNIADDPKEMDVIDRILFRFWQIGWLDKLEKPVPQWIPCAERLPEDEDVLVWYEYFRYGDYNRMYQTYGIGYCSIVNSKVIWGGDVIGHGARAIAWMPLPEPYKEDIEE